jgi:hypothetical protein
VRNSNQCSSGRKFLVECITLTAAVGVPSIARADEWTQVKPISQLSFDGATGNKTIYVENTSGKWSASGCPNARYVMVRGIDGLKEILAIALAAKASSANVSFVGSCLNADYFSATYIKVE